MSSNYKHSPIDHVAEYGDAFAYALRTPLAAIKEFTCIVRDGVDGPVNANQRDHLDLVVRRVHELNCVVDDMFDLNRLRSGSFRIRRKVCDVRDILERLHAKLEHRSDLSLEITADEALPAVYCDADSVSRLIANLVTHVAKRARDRVCMLHVSSEPDQWHVRLRLFSGEKMFDDGDVKVLRQRYKEFDPTLPMRQRCDFDLEIVKHLVQLNLGDIVDDNEQGHGIVITLPIADTARVASRYLNRPRDSSHDPDNTCLIVASVDTEVETCRAEDVDEFLHQNVLPTNLVFRVDIRTWLLLVRGEEQGSEAMIQGLKDARNTTNQIRPTDALPEISLFLRQSWRLGERGVNTSDSGSDDCLSQESAQARHILLVDDDRDIVEAAAIRLQISGYDTRTAYDGEKAIELAARYKPDAIVLDIRMPGMDGLTALQRLKQEADTAHIPVAILSASAVDRERALEFGAQYVLAKPYEAAELIAAVDCLVSTINNAHEASQLCP